MPFAKGKSGNPKGRALDKPFSDALRLEAMRLKKVKGDELDADRRIARALIAKAEKGDASAAREYIDRRDGKAAQSLDLNHGVQDSLAEVLKEINGVTRGLPKP